MAQSGAFHQMAITKGERLAEEATGSDVRDSAITYDEFLTSGYSNTMKRRLDYYNGNQFMFDPTCSLFQGEDMTPEQWNSAMSGYGWDDIRAMLPDATREQCIHPVGIPFVTVVVDNKQVVYTVPPETRTIYKNDQPQEKESALLRRIYSGSKHDYLADQLCKWTGLFDTAFQFVGWDPRNKRIVKRNLKPFEVFVVPAEEDPTDLQHPECFVAIAQLCSGLTDRDAASEEIVWQCWYQDRFWYETSPRAEYKDLELTVPGTMPNPYRDVYGNPVKPILVTHSSETTEMYYQGSDNLVLLNQRLDRDLTSVSHTMEFQGFALLMFTGMDPSEIKALSPSAGSASAIPIGASADYLHPVVQIGEFLAAVINKARGFARLVGIDPELVDPKVDVSSGVSKAHGRMALAERREEQFPKWIPYEREAYWLTSIVWNYYNTATLPEIPRFEYAGDDNSWHLEVVFGELDPVVDPLADAQKIQTDLHNNLVTRPMVLQSRCRISRPAAEKLAEEIKKYNEADGILPPGSPGNPDPGTGMTRIGQPGNRPTNFNRPADKTGGNVTGSSGNQTITRTPRPNAGAGTA